MNLNNAVKSVRWTHDYVIHVEFIDGYSQDLDLSGLFRLGHGEMVDGIRDITVFSRVTVENDTITFPNGYDICPDVLRFYCERGQVVSQSDTDQAFQMYFVESGSVSAVAESKSEYGTP